MIWIKRNYKVVLLTIVFAGVSSLFFAFQVPTGFYEKDSISAAIQAFCFIENNTDLSLSITISAMMFVPIIPLLGVFKRDYGTELWYCITRYRSRKRWFFKKTVFVLILSFVSAGTYFLTVFLATVSRGIFSPHFFFEKSHMFFFFFALRFLFTAFFSILLNIISIFTKLRYIVALGACLVLGCSMESVLEIRLNFTHSLNPYVHATYYFHSQAESGKSLIDGYIFKNITLEKSVVYFVAIIVLTLLIGTIINDKIDIGILEEE